MEKKPRVLISVISGAFGGMEKFPPELCLALQKQNIYTVFVGLKDSKAVKYAKKIGIKKIYSLPSESRISLSNIQKAYSIIKTEKIDIVHFHRGREIYLWGILKRIFFSNIRLIYTQHIGPGKKKDIIHKLFYSLLDRFIVYAYETYEKVKRNVAISYNKVVYIPIGVNVDVSYKYYEERVKRIRDSSRSIFMVGGVSKVIKEKGIIYAIRSMNILINKMGYRDIRLLWLGSIDDDKGYYETVMDEVKRFSLEEYVDFLGFSDKVYDFLSTIDVFLLPSLYETFGFVYIEAMSVGLPVIGTNNGEFPNIISLGASGKVISPYNEKEIADAIIYFYNLGKDEMISIAKKNREFIRNKYAFSMTIDLHIKLYNTLTNFIQDDREGSI